MSFKEKYPHRARIMSFTDEELLDELTRPMGSIEDAWDIDVKREALKRILSKLIKLEKGKK